jgi:hypothetical protein
MTFSFFLLAKIFQTVHNMAIEAEASGRTCGMPDSGRDGVEAISEYALRNPHVDKGRSGGSA